MKENRSYSLAYYGTGSEYFKIFIVNTILTILTLGLYYPWAKEKKLKYLYSKSTFDETPFVFSGTGKEMFKGFIKAIGLLLLVYALVVYIAIKGYPTAAVLFFYCVLLLLVPFALHGAYKYRMSKTSWKGIRFGYTGNRKELLGIFFKGVFLTIITLGIYGSWFAMNIRTYIFSNIKTGDARFVYTGDGSDYFWMNFKGYLLTLLTLGIYMFWWQKDQFDFFVNNTRLEQGEDAVFFNSTATGTGFAGLMIVNLLIIVCTFGLGYAWALNRTMDFIMKNIEASGYYSFDSLVQAQQEYSDATFEDMSELLDVGII
jgi:uncharacterized membrane protein YjgN (DUF898 family)